MGKQTNLNKVDQYSTTAVAGTEGDAQFDYYADSFLPWWHDNGDWSKNGEIGANSVKNPTYSIIEVNKDKIHVVVYQVTGNKGTEEVNGVNMPTSPDFEVVRNGMSRTVIYECEILASDRDRTGRA